MINNDDAFLRNSSCYPPSAWQVVLGEHILVSNAQILVMRLLLLFFPLKKPQKERGTSPYTTTRLPLTHTAHPSRGLFIGHSLPFTSVLPHNRP